MYYPTLSLLAFRKASRDTPVILITTPPTPEQDRIANSTAA